MSGKINAGTLVTGEGILRHTDQGFCPLLPCIWMTGWKGLLLCCCQGLHGRVR